MSDVVMAAIGGFLAAVGVYIFIVPRIVRWLESLDDDELRRCRFRRKKP